MSLALNVSSSSIRVPFWAQCLALALGLIACVAGMVNFIAEWDPGFATVQFLWLAVAPVCWLIERRGPVPTSSDVSPNNSDRRAWILAGLVGLTSWTTCFLVGRDMVDLPPAYHDEYSYLFQAKTLLTGSVTAPGARVHPELFDQMHVLNEGRMASRYYPGTGLWLAHFVRCGHPYWGQWLASAVASFFVFWTGYELGRLRIAAVSGFACALSPGIALFGNLLLAHQPTLMALSIFLWAFVKWQRTRSSVDLLIAGMGLSFAMLCRPATAAGFGFPFGIVFGWWLISSREDGRAASFARRFRALSAIGLPLIAGWAVMLAYHQQVTGSWKTSPYQLYTDIYTPRHVYGFNNVTRGAEKEGPKVIKSYDNWATNLTPVDAAYNTVNRWLNSWLWTFDLLPLLLSSVIVIALLWHLDRRWLPIGFSIVSLHAMHVPYWYVGIMGYHYVFESCLVWCLCLGLATDLLVRTWVASRRWLMPAWWVLLLSISLAADYLPIRNFVPKSTETSRIARGINSIKYPRQKYAAFDRWLLSQISDGPALVLIDSDDQHLDYVVNSPGLNDRILRGRYRPGRTDVQAIMAAFPDRTVYVCRPAQKTIERVRPES